MINKSSRGVMTFSGGIHPVGDGKRLSNAAAVRRAPPKYLRMENGFAVFASPMGELHVRLEGQPVRPAPDALCTLMIRPEAVRTGVDPASVNAFQCVVRDSVFLGETTGLTLDASGFTLHASESAAPERHPCDTVTCSVPPDAIAILPPDLHDVNVEQTAR